MVKRMDILFDGKECQLLNFSDITTYKLLKKEEEKSRLLSMLNTSVHHEMLGPLRANLEVSERLIRNLEQSKLREMAKTIHISSKLVMFHANDLLDQRIIQNGVFNP